MKIEESKKVGSCRELNPAVLIEDCEGWGLPGSHSSVAEPWQLKPGVLEGPFLFTLKESQSSMFSLLYSLPRWQHRSDYCCQYYNQYYGQYYEY